MDDPFWVIQKMGDNAYRLELSDEYGVSLIFNVADLAPFVDPLDSRMSPS